MNSAEPGNAVSEKTNQPVSTLLPMLLLISACAFASLGGCAARSARQPGAPADSLVGRTSISDSQAILSAADQVRQSLAGSEFLKGRTPQSPEIRLLCDRLENFSSDRLSVTDRLAAVWALVSDDGMLELLRERNVKVYFAPRSDDALGAVIGPDWRKWSSPQEPTHVLSARFFSMVRDSSSTPGQLADARTDDFTVSFAIVDNATGAQAWSGQARYRRTSKGLQID